MANTMMLMPDTLEEFMEQYKVVDTEQIYTNGTELVPIFRIKQWFEHIEALPTQPERPLEIQDILDYLDTTLHPIISPEYWNVYSELHDMISTLSAAQPEIIRCKDCKHYQFADNRALGMPVKICEWFGFKDVDDDDFCSRAERKTNE